MKLWTVLMSQPYLFLDADSCQNKVLNQCFIINDHFDHEFDYKTDLELESSIGALDCLNITCVSLLGCSFVAKQGPEITN